MIVDRHLWIIVALIFFFITQNNFLQAQNEVPETSPTLALEPSDRFGKINSESLSARLDNFAVELQNQPNSKGLIVVYPQQNITAGFRYGYAARMKTYLVKNRGIEPKKIIIRVGGVIADLRTELWIITEGSKPIPQVSPQEDLSYESSSKDYLFDNHFYSSPTDFGTCCSIDEYGFEEAEIVLDLFADVLKKNQNLKGYLIGYAQYCIGCQSSSAQDKKGRWYMRDHIQLEPLKAATQILIKEKNYLVKKQGIESSRLVIINGGYRKSRNVELWLVPENGEIPKLKPTTFPPKRSKTAKKKARSR